MNRIALLLLTSALLAPLAALRADEPPAPPQPPAAPQVPAVPAAEEVEEAQEAPENDKTPKVGEVFPLWEGKTYDGKDVKLADYRGKVTLIDFWATWCPPCREELPNLRRVYDRYHEKGFNVVAISLDRADGSLQKWYEDPERTLPWPSAYDGKYWESELADRFGIQGIPAAFLLDKDGKVVATDVRGSTLWRETAKLVDPTGPQPPDVEELVNTVLRSEGAKRDVALKSLHEWSPEFQSDVNQAAWPYLDQEEPTKEGAAVLLGLLKPTADDEKADPMFLDTIALAAYHAGDYAQAAALQQRVNDGYMARFKKNPANAEATLPQLYEAIGDPAMAARMALYQAASGNSAAATEWVGVTEKAYELLKPEPGSKEPAPKLEEDKYLAQAKARLATK